MFSQEKETREVLIYYSEIGGEDIKYYVKKAIMNLLHANSDVHSRMLIAEFAGDGVRYISKNPITLYKHDFFLTEADMIGFYRKLHTKEGNQQ